MRKWSKAEAIEGTKKMRDQGEGSESMNTSALRNPPYGEVPFRRGEGYIFKQLSDLADPLLPTVSSHTLRSEYCLPIELGRSRRGSRSEGSSSKRNGRTGSILFHAQNRIVVCARGPTEELRRVGIFTRDSEIPRLVGPCASHFQISLAWKRTTSDRQTIGLQGRRVWPYQL